MTATEVYNAARKNLAIARTHRERYEALILAIEAAAKIDGDAEAMRQRTLLLAELYRALGEVLLTGSMGPNSDVECAQAFEQSARHFEMLGMSAQWARAQLGIAMAYLRVPADLEPARERLVLDAYRRALTVMTEDASPNEWALIHSNLISFYTDRAEGDRAQNIEEAIEHATTALRVRTREADPLKWAVTQNNLAYALLSRVKGDKRENLTRAILASNSALQVLSPENGREYWAQAHMNLSAGYLERAERQDRNDLVRSMENARLATTVYTSEAAPRDWAGLQVNLAHACAALHSQVGDGYLECALEASSGALSIFDRRTTPVEWAEAQLARAEALLRTMQPDGGQSRARARNAVDEALSILSRATSPYVWARAEGLLGAIYIDREEAVVVDEITLAIDAFNKALTVWTVERQPIEWAVTQRNLGRAHLILVRAGQTKALDDAIATLERARTVVTRERSPELWALVTTDIGDAYRTRASLGEGVAIDQAIVAYKDALSVLSKQDRPLEWATTRGRLGEAYLERTLGDRKNNVALAISALEDAADALSRERQPIEWSRVQMSLSAAYFYSRRWREDGLRKALQSAELARSVVTPQTDELTWARSNSALAGIYLEGPQRRENLPLAIDAATQALRYFDSQRHPDDWRLAQRNLAVAHHWSASFSGEVMGLTQAQPHLRAALTAYREALERSPRVSVPKERLVTLSGLAKVLADLGDWQAVATVAEDASDTMEQLLGDELNEEELRLFVGQASEASSLGALAAARAGDAGLAWKRLERTRARLLSIGLIVDESKLPPEMQARLANLRLELENASRTDNSDAERANRAQSIRSAILRLRASAVGDIVPPQTQNEVVLTMIVTRAGGAVLLRAGNHDEIRLLGRNSKEVLFSQIMGSLTNTSEAKWDWNYGARADAIATDLARSFWGALEHANVAPHSRITWIPPVELSSIPLSPARHPSNGKQLIDLYEIVQAPSYAATSVIAQRVQAREREPLTISAIVNPTGDLPSTELEFALMARVARNIPIQRVAPGQDVRAALAEFGKSNIWHFGTHGDFDWADVRMSGLAMGVDGSGRNHRLTIEDLLFRTPSISPRLVVLTVCESGLNDIKESPAEMLGLPTAFLHAGAAGVVATLWPVEDLSAALLVAKFYDALLPGDLQPSAALRAAQLWLRDSTNADLVTFLQKQRAGSMAAPILTGLDQLIEGLRQGSSEDRPYNEVKYWGGMVFVGQ